MHTEAINHDPAITFIQTGSQLPGRPCMGSWVDYGLGSENQNLPAFVVLNSLPSNGHARPGLAVAALGRGLSAQPLPGRAVPQRGRSGACTFPTRRASRARRRRSQLDGLAALNEKLHERVGRSRDRNAHRAIRDGVPDAGERARLVDTSNEPEHVHELYGEDARKPGTFAANCLLARRLAERNVRFIQLYHRGWDHHGGLTEKLPVLARDTDQPSAA